MWARSRSLSHAIVIAFGRYTSLNSGDHFYKNLSGKGVGSFNGPRPDFFNQKSVGRQTYITMHQISCLLPCWQYAASHIHAQKGFETVGSFDSKCKRLETFIHCVAGFTKYVDQALTVFLLGGMTRYQQPENYQRRKTICLKNTTNHCKICGETLRQNAF
jgi:hypothetical protein